ncbi:MAG: asparagine synthase [Candidatus Helarchaeota archaeon]|nr:asparagine synthase [Candidatus Helarchaeota archaeon]
MEGKNFISHLNMLCVEFNTLMESVIKNNISEGILLSGGLDTSIIASVASNFMSLKAITVGFQNAPAPDLEYASLMAKKLELKHFIHIFDENELYEALPKVIKITASFDPMEIRNSVVIYIGLRIAKENGVHIILTGDGADELFAGYSFLFGLEKEKLDFELKRLSEIMMFSTTPLAKALEMDAKIPFLDAKIQKFARNLDSDFKIHKENGQIYGKWILRKAYEGILPSSILWRVKTPIEIGSGSTILPEFFKRKLRDTEFLDKKKKYYEEDGITIRDKEHLFYYEIYKSILGIPRPTDPDEKTCPQCNSNVHQRATYCRTCGAYPI